MNWKAQRAALYAAIETAVKAAKDDGDRDLTDDEVALVDEKSAAIEAGDVAEAKRVAIKSRIDGLRGTVPSVSGTDDATGSTPDTKSDESTSLMTRFTKSAGYQEMLKAHPSGIGEGTPVRVERAQVGGMKATLTTGLGGGEVITPATRLATVAIPDVPTSLLDIITMGSMSTAGFEYLQELPPTVAAALVAEGELKPQSDFNFRIEQARAYTYADGATVTNQLLADAEGLATYLDGRLRHQLRRVVEAMLLAGTGTNGQPRGILNTTGVQAQAFSVDAFESVALGLEKVQLADGDASAVLISVPDMWKLKRARDNESRFYSNGPWAAGPDTLWGVPMVASRRLTTGQAIVGDFRTVTLFDREGVNVQAFNQHLDYAARNLVYVRAELRAAQAVFQPSWLCTVALAAA